MDQQKFVQLLENVLAPDTERVKFATAELRKEYYTSPDSLGLLLQLLTSHESPQLRQLAATQARSLVPKHWQSIPETHKPQIRTHLLQATLNEQNSLVRHSAARVITTIAKTDVEDGEWADLPTLMQHAAGSSNTQHREVSTYILFTILEGMGDGFMHRFHELFGLFEKTIRDPQSAEVRINTMLALSKMAMIIDSDNDEESLHSFQKALPQMVGVLKDAIDSGDEGRTLQGFEVFQTLLTCDSKLLNKHFGDLVQFMATIGSDKTVDDDARTQAITFLIQAVTYRKLKFQSLRIGEQLTMGILEIVTECGDDSDDEDDQLTVAGAALGLLSEMASNLPPAQTVVPLLRVFNSHANSSDPNRRQAAIKALGTCVEGAPDFISTQIKEFFPTALRLLDDPVLGVREAALSGIRLLADQLAEDMGKEHQKLIPALAKNLDRAMQGLRGPDAKVNLGIVIASCHAIDALVEGLEPDDVKLYLPELVPHLSRLFSHPDLKVKGATIGAIGSIALCAKEEFLPYFEETMNALAEYVQIKDSTEELDLRCMACDTMGNIALAVGSEPFQRYVIPLMNSTEEGLHLGHSRLKETSFLFWGDIAKVYEENFKPFLPGVVKALFQSLEQEEVSTEVELGEEAADLVGQEVVIAGRKVKVAAAEAENGDTTDNMDGVDEDDEDDGDDWDEVTGVTAVALEKECALESLGLVIAHTKGEYLPYLEKSIQTILPLVENAYEGVRRAAISTLFRAYASLWNLQNERSEKWQPGLQLKVQPTEDIRKLGEVVMTATLAVWQGEDDRQTVMDIHSNLAETLRLCGPAIVSGNGVIEKITKLVISVITKKHPCQQDFGDEEEENDIQESSEYDWLIIDTAFDVIMGLSSVLGEQFGQLWKIFEKSIMQYASSSESTERCSAVGAISECIRGMGNAVTPFTSGLLKLLLHRLGDEDAQTKANAAFAIGLLVENSGKDQEILRSYNTILGKLEPLLHAGRSRQLDNAIGCVSRMIKKHKSNVPLSEVLPALVDLLPLKDDYEENEPVYEMIVQLYSSGEPAITSLTPRLIPIVAQVMGPPEEQLTDATRERLLELVAFVHSKQPALVQQHAVLVAALKP